MIALFGTVGISPADITSALIGRSYRPALASVRSSSTAHLERKAANQNRPSCSAESEARRHYVKAARTGTGYSTNCPVLTFHTPTRARYIARPPLITFPGFFSFQSAAYHSAPSYHPTAVAESVHLISHHLHQLSHLIITASPRMSS